MFRLIARSKSRLIVLAALLAAAVLSRDVVAGKPGGGGGPVPPGTIYYADGANYPDIWGMKADGTGKALALPGGHGDAPSSLVYGGDRHRLWLGSETIPGQFYPYYSDPAQNTTERVELFAYRCTPTGAIQKVQLTDLFPGIQPMDHCEWSNDGADSFISFKGIDTRAYFLSENIDDLRWSIFRIRVSGIDIDAAADAGQNLLFGIDQLEEVVTTALGNWGDDLKHSWSPDGNQLALILRSGTSVDTEDLYAKDLTTGQTRLLRDTPANNFAPDFRWSPAGGEIVLGTGSIETIDASTGAPIQTLLPPLRFTNYNGPRWSPDGTQLVLYGTHLKVSGYQYTIYRLPVAGGSLTSLTGDLDATTNKFPIAWVTDTPAAP